MFVDRADAALQLARQLRQRFGQLKNPLILAIPRGGVAVGAVLAKELNADLDVVLSRKLRAPFQPELALGAISEDGHVYINPQAQEIVEDNARYLADEKRIQLEEIGRRKELIRRILPQAAIEGRSIIVTDDGIATGSTMTAALQIIKGQRPERVIVATPVGSPDRLQELRPWCDEVVCLAAPGQLWAIGQFYADFHPLEDDEMSQLLQEFAAFKKTSTEQKTERLVSV